jgi:hypothetical protein
MPWSPETSKNIQKAIQQPKPDFTQTFPADSFDAVEIDASIAGNIAIVGDAAGEARVQGTGYRGNRHLMPTQIEVVDRTLKITARNFLAYLVGFQWGRLELLVQIPPHARVRVRLGAGVVLLHGGGGDVHIRGLVGTVEGKTEARRINVQLGVGEIQLADANAEALLRVGWGAIELLYRRFTGAERIDARCGFGALDIRLPPSALARPNDMAGFFRSVSLPTPEGGLIKAVLGFGGLDLKREPEPEPS